MWGRADPSLADGIIQIVQVAQILKLRYARDVADSPLMIRETWIARVLRALKLVEVRPDGSTDHVAGADFADGQARAPGYKAINSMSALAAFPWVQSSVDAVSSDLSMLPLKVTRGRGKDAEAVDDHPVLDLLDQPTSRMSGILLRRQLVTDLVLCGDAFLLVAGSPEPAALIRLHPERVTVVPSADGQPAAYDYDDGGKTVRYGWEQVLHIRQVSWEDGPRGLYGNGAIRALAKDLTTEQKAAELAANSADTGRPTGIISPSAEGDTWGVRQVEGIRAAWDKQMRKQGGAVILGSGGVTYQALGWSPRDMEYQATRSLVREAVLASIGVPPTRVGLPSANYATAREQAKRYFESLKAKSALIDSSLTRLARMFSGSETVTVSHDFSGVEALQESRDARVNRVQSWWLMGIPLAEAAALEGFNEIAPEEEEAEDAATPAAAGTAEQPVSAQALNGAQIASLLEILAAVASGAITAAAAVHLIGVAFPSITPEAAQAIVAGARAVPETVQEGAETRAYLEQMIHRQGIATLDPLARWLVLDGGGAETPEPETSQVVHWRNFTRDARDTHERRIALSMRRYLMAFGARIAKRLKENLGDRGAPVPVMRALDVATLDKIMDLAVEREIVLGIFRPLFRSMLEDAIKGTNGQLPIDIDFTPERLDKLVNDEIGSMLGTLKEKEHPGILAHTRSEVNTMINAGLAEGQSIGQMQATLIQSQAFSPTRALTIARTESTRAVSAGSIEAMKEAEEKGVRLKKEWRSAQDGNVRDSHKPVTGLHGKQAAIGDDFKLGTVSGPGPGQLVDSLGGSGGENINCRCLAVPIVEGM